MKPAVAFIVEAEPVEGDTCHAVVTAESKISDYIMEIGKRHGWWCTFRVIPVPADQIVDIGEGMGIP